MLVVEYHEELEVDLLKPANGGVDLLDFWRGTLSPRRLDLLIRNLPADSAFIRAFSPDSALLATYSVTDHLLADLFDLTLAAHSDPKKGAPKWHPRPSDEIRDRAANARRAALRDPAARAAAMAAQVARNRKQA